MATNAERIQSIFDAITNEAVEIDRVSRVSLAIFNDTKAELIQMGYDPDTMTVGEKRAVVLYRFRKFVRDILRSRNAGIVTAQDDLNTARATAHTEALVDIPDPGLASS